MKERILNLLRGRITWIPLVFSGLLAAGPAPGEIIPTDRRITWQGNVGVPGGITNRSTIFANVKNAPYNARGDGTSDDTAAIQAALNACPAGQVVYIPAGTYRINTTLYLKNSYTLRGAGPANTILDFYGSTEAMVCFGSNDGNWEHQGDAYVSITGGASKGSTNITVNSTNGIAVGRYILIDQIDDGINVSDAGNEGSQGCCGIRHTQKRHQSQIAEVAAVNGTTIRLSMPLFVDYTNSPEAVPFSAQLKSAGLEDLKLRANNTGYSLNFAMFNVAYCWVKNIESDYADGDHGWVNSSYRCEIRDSYFHDGFLHGPGSHDDTVQFQCGSTAHLFENNIMRRLHVALMISAGGGGHVIAYNFSTNNFDSGAQLAMYPHFVLHGVHVGQILFEGNVAGNFNADGVWGTSDRCTLVRNFFSGQDWSCPPYSGRGAEQTASYQKEYQFNRCINLAGFARNQYFNVVGNVLGTLSMGNYPTYQPTYMVVAPTTIYSDHAGYVWTLGYAGGADDGSIPNDNTLPYDTLINHGNWDVVHKSQTWDGSIPDHVVPSSYYLASKPAFFGNMTWPPIDPATRTNVNGTYIPAGYRYFYGTNPPAGGINQPPVAMANASPTIGISPLAVTFSSAGSSDPEGSVLTYNWTFGDGGTSTVANPTHTYQASSNCVARLMVSDGTNTTISSDITIRVGNQPPTVAVGAVPSIGPPPLAIAFSSAGSSDPEGVPLTYSWTFGDGATSTSANPAHTYQFAGVYAARLTVSDGTNTASSSNITITVSNRPPVVVANAVPAAGAPPLLVSFSSAGSSDPDGATLTYNWIFGDGTTSTAANPTHTYQAASNYSARLTVSDGTNATTSGNLVITVATAASPVVGLVAAYGFDEGSGSAVTDVSSNGNNGTISGAIWTNSGKYGSALVFDGTSALVNISDKALLHLTNGMTLEAWVNPSTVGSVWRPAIYKGNDNYYLMAASATGGAPMMGATCGGVPGDLYGSTALPVNTWTHLAATFDGSTQRLYLNGTQVASRAQTGNMATSTNPLQIGGDTIYGHYFQGMIDEVRIYNVALSPAEIQADMLLGVPRPAPPTNARVVSQ